jgi:transposase
MTSPSTREPTSWPEGRRLRAWQLFQQGWKVGTIAEALGVSHSAVSQWLARARSQGEAALYDRKSPGRPSRLTSEQHARVPELLARGAEAWGFRGDRWTRERVGEVLRREFGVSYHPAHLSRLLARWGQSVQKPQRQAVQRDEAAIAAWRQQQWPAAEKRGRAKAGSCSS